MNKKDENEIIENWRTMFYDKYSHMDCFEDSNFEDIASGFFIALGADPEEAHELYAECINQKIF